jgi:CRP-like cAMP-binding protein
MPALHGLSETEARKLLHRCGVVVQCRAGDHILTRGQASFDVNILLSGKLKSRRFSTIGLKNILPGQHFGAHGLVSNPKQTGNIIAATNVEILVLSSLAFTTFSQSHPETARKVLQNLDGITDHASTVGA